MRIFRILIVGFLLISSLSEYYMYGRERRKIHVQDTYAISCRGVAEMYSGILEGIDARLDFYTNSGYTHYFYSPADDRYCNPWGWKFLYNDSDRQMLKMLIEKCRIRGLEFVWTVNPGDGYAWNDKDYDFLKNKFLMMYYNGIRSFAVRFSGDDGDYQALQDSLSLHLCSSLSEKVQVRVLNDIPAATFPSDADAAMTLMKGYHFDNEFKSEAKNSDAVLCVLKDWSELAKTALVAVAEFARDPYAYVADVAMEKAIMALSPEVKSPLMTFLEHTGGVRESESVTTFTLSEWSREKSSALLSEFEKISRVPEEMAVSSSPVLLESLSPWLTEFGNLGKRGCKTIECLDHYMNKDLGAFWISYIGSRMTDDEKSSYDSHKVGEVKLHPFCINMMTELTNAFTSMLTGGQTLRNLASTLYARPNAALDSDFTTCMHTAGHLVFPIPAMANTCRLLTGPLPEGQILLLRQLATDGSLVAEFVVTSPYSEFDLKAGAVEVDVLGDVDIYESIFVYL